MPSEQDLLFSWQYLAIRFNSKYYGIVLVNRFFDSPMLSYAAFGGGLALVFEAKKVLFREETSENSD